MQGGAFDVPERMFHSIQNEWESASKDNMSDVRELIPEFFYLPDFLVNSNQFDFGKISVLAQQSNGNEKSMEVKEAFFIYFIFNYLLLKSVNVCIDNIGCMQDGTFLDDVVLPPWAKGDPQEFIRVHREVSFSGQGCLKKGPVLWTTSVIISNSSLKAAILTLRLYIRQQRSVQSEHIPSFMKTSMGLNGISVTAPFISS